MSDRRRVLTRRDFVRGTAGAAVGVSIFGLGAGDVLGRETRSASVVLVRDPRVLNESHDVDASVLREMLAGAVTRAAAANPGPRRRGGSGQCGGPRLCGRAR